MTQRLKILLLTFFLATTASAQVSRPANEPLPADNPEVLQFIHERWRQNELSSLDREFIRVIEDVIELLISKNLILFTDLPQAVQAKLNRRNEVRQLTNYQLLDGSDDVIKF